MNNTDPLPTSAPATSDARPLWLRALIMLLMGVAFHLAAWLLGAIAILQLILRATGSESNARLREFGGSLGTYLMEICDFETFRSEQLPFPFRDWPAAR